MFLRMWLIDISLIIEFSRLIQDTMLKCGRRNESEQASAFIELRHNMCLPTWPESLH